MRVTKQDQSLATALSFHPNPQAKQDPGNHRNNPMNLPQPQQHVYGLLYGDGQIAAEGTNVRINPAAQQQISLYPQGRLPGGTSLITPGHPEQIPSTDLLNQLGDPRRTSTAAMGASQQRPQGNPRAAMDRGISGAMASGAQETRGGRARGFNTSIVGGRRA
jgi:hypothetical protein